MDNKDECKEYEKYKDKRKIKNMMNMIKRKNMRTIKILLM